MRARGEGGDEVDGVNDDGDDRREGIVIGDDGRGGIVIGDNGREGIAIGDDE